MGETFTFLLDHNKLQEEFEASFERRGYSYRIGVRVKDMTIWFEPDEERNFRAVLADEYIGRSIDIKLVEAIAQKLEELFR